MYIYVCISVAVYGDIDGLEQNCGISKVLLY